MNQWKGEPIEDKSLLVWSDQGLGDSIMVARYIPKIKARRVVVYVDAAIFRLLRHSLQPYGVEVLMKGWAFPKTDLHVPMMSLMQCFGLERESQIPQGKYLKAPAKHFDLPHAAQLIGLNWQGNKRMVRDFTRSLPSFAVAEPLLEHGTFVSLQKGNAQKEIVGKPICDVMDECHDVADTASLIQHLDLVITTDTVIPHLAGALYKQPVWLLEAYESEWRWGLGATSPWYENVRIFRQPQPGDWASVVAKVARELRLMKGHDDAFQDKRGYSEELAA
jgi:hypothetical protein